MWISSFLLILNKAKCLHVSVKDQCTLLLTQYRMTLKIQALASEELWYCMVKELHGEVILVYAFLFAHVPFSSSRGWSCSDVWIYIFPEEKVKLHYCVISIWVLWRPLRFLVWKLPLFMYYTVWCFGNYQKNSCL